MKGAGCCRALPFLPDWRCANGAVCAKVLAALFVLQRRRAKFTRCTVRVRMHGAATSGGSCVRSYGRPMWHRGALGPPESVLLNCVQCACMPACGHGMHCAVPALPCGMRAQRLAMQVACPGWHSTDSHGAASGVAAVALGRSLGCSKQLVASFALLLGA